MYAWVWALLSLLTTGPSVSRTANLGHTDLAVYLVTGRNQPAAPLENMKSELSGIMRSAGYRVVYDDARAPDPQGRFSALAVLELRGTCGIPAGSFRGERGLASGASLAETAVSSGVVLPFSRIDCPNLTRLIGPLLGDEPVGQRDYLYGRAMARVAAHELYHVMMGSREHCRQGVAKASFSVNDLLNEGFDFDGAALALLRRKAAEGETHGDAPDEPAARR
jgi:hypothetical protein